MIAVLSPSTNPYFNIALEYYLLHFYDDEILLVYRNKPSVIVGKHQNAFAEANQKFLQQTNIPLIRRISGGGTVYHDLGNINTTIIREGKLNFNTLLIPINTILKKIGIETVITEKNDLLVEGKKITGTAAHVYKNKSLHHGTLLYNASQELLHQCLKGKKSCFIDKAVCSRPSPTINLMEYSNDKISNDEFMWFVFQELKAIYTIKSNYDLTEHDIEIANHWAGAKFSTWEWNYAYSPAFDFNNKIIENNAEISIEMTVKNGLIEKSALNVDNQCFLLEFIHNLKFCRTEIIEQLKGWSKKNCPTLTLGSLEKLFDF